MCSGFLVILFICSHPIPETQIITFAAIRKNYQKTQKNFLDVRNFYVIFAPQLRE
jgi:hypothetical protein